MAPPKIPKHKDSLFLTLPYIIFNQIEYCEHIQIITLLLLMET